MALNWERPSTHPQTPISMAMRLRAIKAHVRVAVTLSEVPTTSLAARAHL